MHEQHLHCSPICPGASHVQWGVPELTITGLQSVFFTLPIRYKQLLHNPAACTYSLKVTCSNVQWGKFILGEDIGVWYKWCVCICACARVRDRHSISQYSKVINVHLLTMGIQAAVSGMIEVCKAHHAINVVHSHSLIHTGPLK